MPKPDERRNRRAQPLEDDLYDDEEIEQEEDVLLTTARPGSSLQAFMIGISSGLIYALLTIAITLLNANAFNSSVQNTNDKPVTADGVLFGLGCLNLIMFVLICIISGYLFSSLTRQRRLSFLTGAITAGTIYIANIVTTYIPSYPNNLPTQPATNTGNFMLGILTSGGFLLAAMLIGGLLGIWGSLLALRPAKR